MPTPTQQGMKEGDRLRQQAAKLEAEVAMYTEQAKSGSREAAAKLQVAKENLARIRTSLKGKGTAGYKKGGMVKKAKGGYANCGASMKPTQKFACGGMVSKQKKK
jgi:hypothetical protein